MVCLNLLGMQPRLNQLCHRKAQDKLLWVNYDVIFFSVGLCKPHSFAWIWNILVENSREVDRYNIRALRVQNRSLDINQVVRQQVNLARIVNHQSFNGCRLRVEPCVLGKLANVDVEVARGLHWLYAYFDLAARGVEKAVGLVLEVAGLTSEEHSL